MLMFGNEPLFSAVAHKTEYELNIKMLVLFIHYRNVDLDGKPG